MLIKLLDTDLIRRLEKGIVDINANQARKYIQLGKAIALEELKEGEQKKENRYSSKNEDFISPENKIFEKIVSPENINNNVTIYPGPKEPLFDNINN